MSRTMHYAGQEIRLRDDADLAALRADIEKIVTAGSGWLVVPAKGRGETQVFVSQGVAVQVTDRPVSSGGGASFV